MMNKKIDVSLWNPDQMPLVLEGFIGYAADPVQIDGGTRYYHYFKLWKWGIEVAIAVAQTEGVTRHEQNDGRPAEQTAPST